MPNSRIAEPGTVPAERSPGEAPLVSVVVVNYNGAEALEGCLTALVGDSAAPLIEILVVDNASEDASPQIAERFAASSEAVRLLRSPVNRGYAGGVNVALAEAEGRYVAVLNMDVVVSDGWLRPLLAELASSPEVGAVCPLIVLESDHGTINAAGQQLHVTGLGFNHLLGEPAASAGADPLPVSGIHGGAFVIRREIFDRLGGWDESGFLYAEDVQLSWLLQLIGAEVRCVPASRVSHDYHLTMHPTKLYLLERNRAAMLLADLRWATLAAMAPALAVTELMIWAYALLRGPRFLAAKLRSYRWLVAQRRGIRARRELARSLRRRSDRQILRRLRWGYPWRQFLTLGRERGLAERRAIPARD